MTTTYIILYLYIMEELFENPIQKRIKKKKEKFTIPSSITEEGLLIAEDNYFNLKNPTEEQLQKLVTYFLRVRYPEVIFRSDAGGLKMSLGLAVKFKSIQSSRAYPDLFIVKKNKYFSGLFLELKKENETLFNKRGEYKSEHLIEQSHILSILYKEGFQATFSVGYKETKNLIINYLESC